MHALAWMRAGLCLCTGGAHVAASLAQVVTYAAKSVRCSQGRAQRTRATAPMTARLHFSPEAPVGKHGPFGPPTGASGAMRGRCGDEEVRVMWLCK